MECIVLAGGLGTRLRGAIGDYPKCMAPVNERPFLHYLFTYLAEQSCTRVVLSLGYKHEVITKWLKQEEWPFEITPVIEQEPLGTGGGIKLAIEKTLADNVAVLNGDTMFRADLGELFVSHHSSNASVTLALKSMVHFDRYGAVNTDNKNCIISFEEKQYKESGLINGGIYIINKPAFLGKDLPVKFSFEKDFLEKFVSEQKFYGFVSNGYFIDIGIPEDYEQAQSDFKKIF